MSASPQIPRHRRKSAIAALRARLAALDGGAAGTASPLPSGLAALDRLCPNGLPAGVVHEMWAGAGARVAAAGFALGLAASLPGRRAGDLVWIYLRRTVREWGLPYGPGLMALGHDPGRVLLIEAGSVAEALWACEEALGAAGVAFAIASVDGAYGQDGLGASRRLELAARAAGRSAFVLCSGPDPPPSAASLRWQVTPLAGGAGAAIAAIAADTALPSPASAPALFSSRARWQVALMRNRWGRTGCWTVEWDHGWQRLDTSPSPFGAVAAPLAGRTGPADLAVQGPGGEGWRRSA